MGRYFLIKTVDFSRNAIVLPPDYSKQYLTFEALEDGTFSFSKAISYSIDDGQTWTTLTANTQSPTISTGDTILWKGNLTATGNNGIGRFSSTGRFSANGNIMSLLYGNNFEDKNVITYTYCFLALFYNSKIVNAHNLILPATTLTTGCYLNMFGSCTSLITPPELPAITLNYNCYSGLFRNCSSLTTAPELPAVELVDECYYQMFDGCTSLTTGPELPATRLSPWCYRGLFYGCYRLNYIKMMATDISAQSCLYEWVSGVSSTGTFVKNANATWTTTGSSGVPTGWTVITE